jgi:hypothetical protein
MWFMPLPLMSIPEDWVEGVEIAGQLVYNDAARTFNATSEDPDLFRRSDKQARVLICVLGYSIDPDPKNDAIRQKLNRTLAYLDARINIHEP